MTFIEQANTCPPVSNQQTATQRVPDLARMGVGKRCRQLPWRTPVAARSALLCLLASALLASGANATSPANDTLGSAEHMTGFPASASGSNVGATKGNSDP